jgi:tetratricopeptide (TPR) repeat protein
MSNKAKNSTQQGEAIENVEQILSKSEAFIEKYQNQILIAVGAIVLGVLAVMGYSRFILEPQEVEAQKLMYKGEQYFAVDSFRLAIDGDGDFMGFKYIMDEFGATKSANLAAYYTGISYMRLGQFEEAIDYLNDFDSDDQLIAPVALGAKGDCYMELGKYDKAYSCFKDAADFENEFTTPIHLQKAGIALEAQGKQAKAVEIYTIIKDKYSSSSEAREIEKYIERAKATM